MKIKKQRYWILITLAVLLLFGGCNRTAMPNADGNGTQAPIKPTEPFYHRYQDVEYSYMTDVDVSALTTGLDTEFLLLVNKTKPLSEGYEPSNLVELTCKTSKPMKLDGKAAAALYEMMDEMKAAGIDDVLVTSAYRTFDYQQNLYNKYIVNEQKTISKEAYAFFSYEYLYQNYLTQNKHALNYADAVAVAQYYSAPPGASEHHTGLCVDFITEDMGGILDERFAEKDAFAWLSQNAHRFGFVLRYPEEKQSVTGYIYEPWHYRFVGREAATDIYYSGLTLEEYLTALGM